jgi:hypothetical protein
VAQTKFSERRTYVIGKAKPNAMIGRNRESGELFVLVAGGALGLLFGLVAPALPVRITGLVGFPLLAFAAVFLPYRKRTFYKWFEINRAYKRLLRSGSKYRSPVMEQGIRMDGTPYPHPEPPGIGRITWTTVPFGMDQLTVLVHVERRTVTAAVEIEGPGVGLRDPEDQEVLVERFGTLLKHVANSDGFVTRLQMLSRTLSADPDAHLRDVERRGDARSPYWIKSSYDELQSMVSTSSEQHRYYVVAHMPYTADLAAEALAIGEGDTGLGVVMAREMTDICARLADASIKIKQPLDEPRLASLIQGMYDPDHPIDAYDGMQARHAWPAELDATNPAFLTAQSRGSLEAGPWYHATAWVKEWPLTPVAVNFLSALLVHTPDVIRTIAVTMELEPTDVAIERMLTEKTNDDADASRAAKMNRTADPRDRAQSGRVDQRGEDLASGAGGVCLVGYITVSARTPEDLARDQRTIRAAAGKSFLKLEWCNREHHRAFTNTLPFATGLRR